jgi:hypothetical protein
MTRIAFIADRPRRVYTPSMRLLAALLLVAALPAAATGQAGTAAPSGTTAPDVVFDWAIVKRGPTGAPVRVEFAERVTVARGDLFKIHLQPIAKNTFIYLFLHDAAGTLSMLFPDRFEAFQERGYTGTPFFIPPGEDWFALDGSTGTERFYLVASSERLKELERLTTALRTAASAEMATARQRVLDEIAALRREHSQLAIAAEKPVAIAGGTRGISDTVEKMGTRIEAVRLYARTFRLEH